MADSPCKSHRVRQELTAWLQSAGVDESYVDVLLKEEVDVASLRLLTEQDLESLGFKLGPRRRIRAQILSEGTVPAQKEKTALSSPSSTTAVSVANAVPDAAPGSVGTVTMVNGASAAPSTHNKQKPSSKTASNSASEESGKKTNKGSSGTANSGGISSGGVGADDRAMITGVTLKEELGRGSFGVVFKGLWHSVPVAVKKLVDTDATQEFVEEAHISALFRHPNVVLLYGLYLNTARVLHVVTEFAQAGSLLDLLREEGESLGIEELLAMCMDIASGMAYLSSKGIVHRDLAARNILVFSSPFEVGRKTLKISDFGLSRFLQGGKYLRTSGIVPTRWTALEAIETDIFTVQSDVWSFGVVMWEIFSPNDKPYKAQENKEEVLAYLKSGKRLEKPARCPSKVYDLMTACWNSNPDLRPPFLACFKALQAVLDALKRKRKLSQSSPDIIRSEFDVCAALEEVNSGRSSPTVSPFPTASPSPSPFGATKIVTLPSGVHFLSRTILLKNGESLEVRGHESGSSILRTKAGLPAFEVRGGAQLVLTEVELESTATVDEEPSRLIICSGQGSKITINKGRAQGGPILLEDSAVGQISWCDICAPQGTGVISLTGTSLEIEHCKFLGCQTGIRVVGSCKLDVSVTHITGCEKGVELMNCGESTCLFKECQIGGGGTRTCVVVIGQDSRPVFDDCDIRESLRRGVLVQKGARPKFKESHFWGHERLAIEVESCGAPKIVACTIRTCRAGIFIKNGGTGLYKDCDLWGFDLTGIELSAGADPVFQHCAVHECEQSAVFAHDEAKGTFKGCLLWGNAYSGVEIASCSILIDGCEIRTCSNCVSIEGKGSSVTINDSNLHDSDLGLRATSGSEVKFTASHLHGCKGGAIIIEESQAYLSECKITNNEGSGLMLDVGANVELRLCEISNHTEYGIISVEDPSSTCKIIDCNIHSNMAGEKCTVSPD